MRPTSLEFRSPKEKTPAGYLPKLNYVGQSLSFNSPKSKNEHFTFSTAKRFSQYATESTKTGYHLGPGAYSPDMYKTRVKGSPLYKRPHKAMGNNGYFYVGDQLMFEPSYAKNEVQQLSATVDSSSYLMKSSLKKNGYFNTCLLYTSPSPRDS